LEFSNPGLPENEIQYRKVNLVPFGENMLAGSNYHNHDFREGPDEDGLAEIEKLARESFRVELELKNQRWGIRPTTHDRRPRILQHPNWKNLWMFNGLGSKGALSGPLLARNFVKEDLYGN
jgi:glycine/D-amino acid oxidase-like deaminating enzyme